MEGISTTGEIDLNLTTTTTEEPGVGDNFLTFLDESSSVVFKGVLDQNGTFLVDPSQFVNILMDQSQSQAHDSMTTTNGMTIQVISMPPAYSMGEKQISNEKLTIGTGSHQFQTFQLQTEPRIHDACDPTVNSIQLDSEAFKSTNQLSSTELSTTAESRRIIGPENGLLSVEFKKPRTKTKPVKLVSDTSGIEPPIGKGPFLCSICLKSFVGLQQLRRHKAEHLNEKQFRCRDCTLQFNFEINLKLHMMVHEAEESGNLQCQMCLAKFSRLASLKSHLRIHEKEENLVCSECGEEVPTLARLNEHMDEHRTRVQQCMVYRCKLCAKPFNSQALLRDHSKEHTAVRKELKVFARQKPRSKVKNRTSSVTGNWNTSKKKRICTVCSKGFDKPSQLARHFRIHSGEKPFKCTYSECKKSFTQKVTLESHVLACHQGLKPFQCHLCTLCFSQRGNLKNHIIKVHIPSAENEKVFQCDECACVYRRLATLNNHIARMHAVASSDHPMHSNFVVPDEVINSEILILASPPPNDIIDANQDDIQAQLQSHARPASNQSLMENPGIQSRLQTTIHEINCVYNVFQGTSKKCLVKVKTIGRTKFHLCPICPKSFRKPSDLIRHTRTHTSERPFSCQVCARCFAVKSTLTTHLKTHDPCKKLSCGVCQKKFHVLSSLKSHERLHLGLKPFSCLQCGKQFRTSSQRRVHLKTHNRSGLSGRRKLLRIGDDKPGIELPDPLKITCDGLVPVPNRAIRTLVNGALVDQRTRPYRCTQAGCIASFKKSSHLKQHQRSHTGERPYKCIQCHRDFISSGVLKNHIKTHEGIREFTCKICNVAFTTNGSLTRHMASHETEKLYVCPYCAKTFKTSVATRKHIKVHRNEIIPFHSVGVENPRPGIVIHDQSQSLAEVSLNQQFSNTQDFNAAGLAALYDNDYTDVNAVLTGDINIRETKQNLAVQIDNSLPSDNTLNGFVPISCENSEIIHNIDGTVTLQYTTLDDSETNSEQNSTGNIQIRLDQDGNFDPAIYALQQGESLDLQFLQDSEEIENDTENCLSQLESYDYPATTPVVSPGTNAKLSKEAVDRKCIPEILTQDTSQVNETSHKKVMVSSGKTKEAIEVKKIREASRPISEQLYTELSTQPYQRRPREPPNFPVQGKSLSDKLNECLTCHTRFKKKSDLQRHLRIHTGEKPYRCGLCGKSFRVKSTRQAHMRTHEERKKTVSCHVCHNLFSTKSSLRVHLRLHLNLKPYQCPYPNCSRNFRTSGHRKCHIQSHFKASKTLEAAAAIAAAAEREKVSIAEGGSNFVQQDPNTVLGQILLPPVETLKDIKPGNHHRQLDVTGLHVGSNVNNPTNETTDNIHVIGGVQLQLDGLQFASLDLSSLQVDENFLQNVTNVILFPPTSQGSSTSLVNGTTNMVIGMLPTQELSSTDLLTGKDMTLSLNLLGTSGITADQLASGQLTLADNVHQYIINNNEMMSSTARPSHGRQESMPSTYILSTSSDLICPTCHIPCTTKQELQKHEKTHLSKPFKCSLCSRSFSQKSSLDTHIQAHLKEKKEFVCPLCPFSTQRKQNLKTHFTRAHPNNWTEFNDTVGSTSKGNVS